MDTTETTAAGTAAGDAITQLRETGLVPGLRRIPSTNRDARPPDATIELIIVHNITVPAGEFGGNGIVELFTNRLDPAAHPSYAELAPLRVAAHFLIRRDGEAIQFVSCLQRAWHAGDSSWNGREACNDFSVGIELEGTDDQPYTPAQYAKLIGLSQLLIRAYPVRQAAGHSDVAPRRKTDPGPAFNWRLFCNATGLKRR